MPSLTLYPSRRHGASRPLEEGPGATARRLANPSVFLAVILTTQLMVVLDSTIVNVALPHIQHSLHFSTSSLSWVLNAYILTFGGLLLLGARAGDLFGRRRVFLIGMALFTASSLVGGLAVDPWMLLITRAIQGSGAALAAPSALSLLTTVFKEGQARVRAIGLYTTVSAAGAATGLVAGGLLTELVSWRWVMFVNVPIGIAVLIVGSQVIQETERRQGQFDLVGALTSTFGVSGIVLGLVEAGSSGWGAPITITSFVAGALLLYGFVRQEARAPEPILPLRLLSHRTRNAANLARGLLYSGFFGLFYFMAQFLQDVHGYSPLRTGFAFLPIPISIFASSQLVSRVLHRRLPPKLLMAGGTVVAMAGLLLATQVGVATGYGSIVIDFLLIGMGCGTAFVGLTSMSLTDVDPGDAGAASGLVNVSQQLGAALGVAILVTIFDSLTGHATLGAGVAGSAAQAQVVHAIDKVFGVGGLLSLAALVAIVVGIRRGGPQVQAAGVAPAVDDEAADLELIALLDGPMAPEAA